MQLLSVDDLAAQVPHGASVSAQGRRGPTCPWALAMALIRRGVRALHVVTLPTAAYPASGMMADLLIGAGCVASVDFGHLAARAGCGAALHAGGEGRHARCWTPPALPSTPRCRPAPKTSCLRRCAGWIGSDLLRHRPDWRVIVTLPHPTRRARRICRCCRR